MNVFKFELLKDKMSLVYWGIGISSFVLFYMGFYPLIKDQQQSMDLILQYYPEELLKALGMSNTLSLSTLEGYLPFVFVFIQLILAVFASIKGFSVLSREESNQTADFLFSKPIKRQTLFMTKTSAGLIQLLLVWLINVVSIHGASIIFASEESLSWSILVPLYGSLFIFMLLYFSVGMMLSMMSKYVRSTLGYAMGLSFLTYAIYSLAGIIDSAWLGYFTPFQYFEAASIITNSGLDGVFISMSLVIVVVSGIGSYRLFLKRNLTII